MFCLLLLLVAVATAERVVPANDPAVWTVGRTRQNGDGSLSFDWESSQFYVNVKGANYVKMHMKAQGNFFCLSSGVGYSWLLNKSKVVCIRRKVEFSKSTFLSISTLVALGAPGLFGILTDYIIIRQYYRPVSD